MNTANWFVRRLFAYPALFLGLIFTGIGGVCIKFSAWAIDFNLNAEA